MFGRSWIAGARLIAALGVGLPLAAAVQGGPTTQEMNNSNNPLTPALGVNLQDHRRWPDGSRRQASGRASGGCLP